MHTLQPEVFRLSHKIDNFKADILASETIVSIELYGSVAMVVSHVTGLNTCVAIAEKQTESIKVTKQSVLGAVFIFYYI